MYIRPTIPIDAAGIIEIYKDYVEKTSITFENTIPSISELALRIEQIRLKYPWLVAEEHGNMVGYAYATAYRDRIAYQWMAETSIYVLKDKQNTGLAQKLYNSLLELLTEQGIYKAYAVITIPNEKSIRFHEKMGFTHFATYKKVGYKLGTWHDVGWWEKELTLPNTVPLPPIPFQKFEKEC